MAFIAKAVFGKDTIEYEAADPEQMSDTDEVFSKVSLLLEQGEVCGAEDLIFENADPSDTEYLRMAMAFYQNVNRMTDSELEKADFSRAEIEEGIRDLMKLYGITEVI